MPLSGSSAGAFAVLNLRTFITPLTTESGVRRGSVSVGVETATCLAFPLKRKGARHFCQLTDGLLHVFAGWTCTLTWRSSALLPIACSCHSAKATILTKGIRCRGEVLAEAAGFAGDSAATRNDLALLTFMCSLWKHIESHNTTSGALVHSMHFTSFANFAGVWSFILHCFHLHFLLYLLAFWFDVWLFGCPRFRSKLSSQSLVAIAKRCVAQAGRRKQQLPKWYGSNIREN